MGKNKNAFKLASEARKGKLDPAILTGAAKRLHDDTSLTDELLADYSITTEIKRTRITQQNHPTFKY